MFYLSIMFYLFQLYIYTDQYCCNTTQQTIEHEISQPNISITTQLHYCTIVLQCILIIAKLTLMHVLCFVRHFNLSFIRGSIKPAPPSYFHPIPHGCWRIHCWPNVQNGKFVVYRINISTIVVVNNISHIPKPRKNKACESTIQV